MAKKKAKKNQKLRKQLQFQQLSAGRREASLPIAEKISAPEPLLAAVPAVPTITTDYHLWPEIRRTIISVGVVAVLLISAVILNQKTSYLETFGRWLFHFLRLNS